MTDPAAEPVESADPADPAEPPAPPPRWGLADAALAFLVGMLFAIVVDGIYILVSGSEEGLGHTIATLVGLWIGLAGVPYLASRRKGTGSVAEDFGLRLERRDVGIGVLAGALSQFVLVNLVVALFRFLGPDVNIGRQARDLTNDAEGIMLGVLAPFLILGAPLVEELFFRGLLQRSIARRLGPPIAIVGSAVAFGLVHLQPDLTGWSQLALTTALASFGIVLGVLAQRAGRLGPSLVAHATFNTITLVALAVS